MTATATASEGEPTASETEPTASPSEGQALGGHADVPALFDDAGIVRAGKARVHVLRPPDGGALVAVLTVTTTIPPHHLERCISDALTIGVIIQSLPPGFLKCLN